MNKVTKEQIEQLFEGATKEIKHAVFGKMCILVIQLGNGFTLVGESACVDPENYDPDIGYQIAKEKIIDKLWELEGYNLQAKLAENLVNTVTMYDGNGQPYLKIPKTGEIKSPIPKK